VPSISVAPSAGTITMPTAPAPATASVASAPATPIAPGAMNTQPIAQPVPEKDSYGTAIFLVVIIFILILGGIVGYAYVNHIGPFEQPAPAVIQNALPN
jgi:uncharacterized ion transporter superfamily protein YfcC